MKSKDEVKLDPMNSYKRRIVHSIASEYYNIETESFGEEHVMELDGALQDNKTHTLTLSLEVETNIPVFNNKTIMPSTIISKPVINTYTKIDETK